MQVECQYKICDNSGSCVNAMELRHDFDELRSGQRQICVGTTVINTLSGERALQLILLLISLEIAAYLINEYS